MGYIFNGDVVAQKIYDPNDFVNPLPATILASITGNDINSVSVRHPGRNVNTDIIDGYTNNYHTRVRRYLDHYRFNHTDDIPSNINIAEYATDNPLDSNYVEPHPKIKEIIENEIGKEIKIIRYRYGRPIPQMLARHYFLQDHLNDYTLVLTNQQFTYGSFLENATGKYYYPTTYSHVGTTLTVNAYPLIFHDGSSQSGDIGWLPEWDNAKKFTLNLASSSGILPGNRVHQVAYKRKDNDRLGIWFFNESNYIYNTDPDYDEVYQSAIYVERDNESYPFAMIVEEGKQVIKGEVGEIYKRETERALEKIGLNLEMLMEGLSGPPRDPDQPESETNPKGDINEDIKDAFILYAASLDTQENSSLQYIYEHFRQLFYKEYNLILKMQQAHEHWYANRNVPNIPWENRFLKPKGMNFYNTRVQFMINFNWMSLKVKQGLINDNSTLNNPLTTRPSDAYLYSSANAGFDSNPLNEIDKNNQGVISGRWNDPNTAGQKSSVVKVGEIKMFTFAGNNYATDLDTPEIINDDLYILRKQLTVGMKDVSGNWVIQPTYAEMIIMGLTHSSQLTNPNTDITAGGGGKVLNIVTKISDSDNGKFFLPLSVNVMNKFNTLVRSEILYKNLTLSLTIYNKTKLPWYADKNLMLGIRAFMFVVSFGSSEGILQVIFEAIKQIAYQFIIGIAITEVLTLLIELVGGEVALYLATVAVVFAMVKNAGIKSLDLLFDLVSPTQLMEAATMITGAVKEIVEEEAEELQAEIKAFEEEKEEMEKELQALRDELGPSYVIDYTKISLRASPPNFYETPDEYFNRTIHLGNPGVLSLDALDLYVTNNLQLPQYRGS